MKRVRVVHYVPSGERTSLCFVTSPLFSSDLMSKVTCVKCQAKAVARDLPCLGKLRKALEETK
jgi:hypothetical protein